MSPLVSKSVIAMLRSEKFIFYIFSLNMGTILNTTGGDDVPKLELTKQLNYRIVDKIVRDLERIYKENYIYFNDVDLGEWETPGLLEFIKFVTCVKLSSCAV